MSTFGPAPGFWLAVAFLVFVVVWHGYGLALALGAWRGLRDQQLARAFASTEAATALPPISVLVPACNEEASIVAAVRALLQSSYPDFEILVVNDGSRDRTRQVLVAEFAMHEVPAAVRVQLPSAPIRAMYRSSLHPQLRLVDKERGGKADALNAGIDVSTRPLFCVVDVDTRLHPEALARLVQPVLDDSRVLAVCAGISAATHGADAGAVAVPPLPWLARIQRVEFLRRFLFARVGWARWNAVLPTSAGVALLRKSAVVEAGGYRGGASRTDMELVLRLHRHRRLEALPYRIAFVAEALGWTAAAEDWQALREQRRRWQRGLLEGLWHHRDLLLHPRGGVVGWLALPALLLFEALAPLIEVLAGLALVLGWLLGAMSATSVAILALAALSLGVLVAASTLLLAECRGGPDPNLKPLRPWLMAMLLENLGYRQLIGLWLLTGVLQSAPAARPESRRR